MSEPFSSKLGKTRAGERSRIWLEGKRLIAAGFTPGTAYGAVWTDSALHIVPVDSMTLPHGVVHVEPRVVSGKGDKPIIDIVGARVAQTFGKHGERVSVTYDAGRIVIRAEVA